MTSKFRTTLSLRGPESSSKLSGQTGLLHAQITQLATQPIAFAENRCIGRQADVYLTAWKLGLRLTAALRTGDLPDLRVSFLKLLCNLNDFCADGKKLDLQRSPAVVFRLGDLLSDLVTSRKQYKREDCQETQSDMTFVARWRIQQLTLGGALREARLSHPLIIAGIV